MSSPESHAIHKKVLKAVLDYGELPNRTNLEGLKKVAAEFFHHKQVIHARNVERDRKRREGLKK